MIPFSNTWPYDVVGNDVYVHSPFCGTDNVFADETQRADKRKEGKRSADLPLATTK